MFRKKNKIVCYLPAILVLVLSIGVSSLAAQICTPAPVGLISSYAAENNALDARSRNNGTIQGNVTYAAGQAGQGFQLGGANGDRVLLGSPRDFQRQDFTIEAWVKRSSSSVVTNSPSGSGVGIFFAYGQGGYSFYIDQTTNKLVFGQVGVSQVFAPTLTITDTNWHHVAVTQSGPAFTAGTQTIFYLDGIADTPVGYAPQFSFTTNAAIGSRGDAQTDNVFFGEIDELSIYDRPLSAAQIQAIFASGTAGKCKPLATNALDNQVLWLAGDGDALDLSSNGNGSLQNGTGYAVGKVGQSFKFDGVDDQITVPDNANQNGGTNLTIEAWINPASLPHGGTILQKRTSGNFGGYVLESTQPSGSGAPNGLQFVIMIGGVYQALNPANILTPNVWQHVAATYDGAFMRIYVGGVEVANKPQTGAIDLVAAPLVIGRNVVSNVGFQGGIDEIGLYNRALSAAEIGSIYNAGLAGKYKVQATVPANIAAWYPADGNTNDLQAANSATLQGGATYVPGKVGQAFALNGTTAYVAAPNTAANDPTGTGTGASMEAWVYFNQRPSDAGHQMYIISKSGGNPNDGFDIHVDADNYFKFVWQGSYTGFANFQVQAGVWYHVVATFSPTTGVRFYANGVLLGIGNVFSSRTASNVPLEIGHSTALGGNRFFNGLIDEPAMYNRTLSEAEIRDQYYAGNLGKYKAATNPTVSNKTKTGDAEVTFATLTAAGAVQEMPLNASLLPALPVTNTGLVYDISTSAADSNPTVCFNLPSFTVGQFAGLRIYHLESGAWVNRTAPVNSYPNLCSSGLTSLSPFAIGFSTETAASASVGGRVTFQKRGLSNATVMISGGSLAQPILAKTGSFGYYKFDNLPVGETYFLTVFSKRYVFMQPTQIVNLFEDVTNADFMGEIP